MKYSIYHTLIYLFTVAVAIGQPQLELKYLSEKYPDEKMVVVKNQKTLHYRIVEGKLTVSASEYEECMYLDARAGIYSERSLHFSSLEKMDKINALSLVPKKNKYKKIRIDEFKTDSLLSRDVFYDGTNKISFFYPSLGQGAKSVLEYSKTIMEPRLTGAYFFQEFVPVIESEYRVVVPDNVEVGWKLFNTHDSAVDFTMEKKKDLITYTWKMKNLAKYPREESAPNVRYSIPHIISWIKSYTAGDQKKSFLNNPEDLYRWYYEITRDVNNSDCIELKAVVDSIVIGKNSEQDKAKEIFYWVQDNIKYIAIEDGMGGFVPRSARSVFERRYGDCKDMASILTAMLRYAGIKQAYLTWIGSRDIPYNYSQVPTPSVNNHMIVTYISGDKYFFLDATGRNISFDLPTPFIQGKEALIGIDSARYLIKTVPEITTEINRCTDTIELSLSHNTLIGHARSVFSGHYDYTASDYLLGNKDDLKKVLRDYLAKGSNKFVLDSFAVGNLNDRDNPLAITYSFNIRDYARQMGDEIFVNLVMDESFPREDIENERKNDIEKRFKGHYGNIIRFKIPEGYRAEYIPGDSSFSDEKFGYNISYRKEENYILLNYFVYTNYMILQKQDFETWNSMIKKLQKANSEMIVLKKL